MPLNKRIENPFDSGGRKDSLTTEKVYLEIEN